MIETRDKKTGITRHEYGTVNPGKCRECLDCMGEIKKRYEGNRVVRYLAELNGSPIEIHSTPTRTILFSPNRYTLIEFAKKMQPEEWVYENESRTDYVPKSQGGL